ncbi:hypothetical protein MELB17_13152 [Marinobacter sp. ELB17]|nr:hypothetical protein MELB17_13152 [Marinobacter sp. ELB17]
MLIKIERIVAKSIYMVRAAWRQSSEDIVIDRVASFLEIFKGQRHRLKVVKNDQNDQGAEVNLKPATY